MSSLAVVYTQLTGSLLSQAEDLRRWQQFQVSLQSLRQHSGLPVYYVHVQSKTEGAVALTERQKFCQLHHVHFLDAGKYVNLLAVHPLGNCLESYPLPHKLLALQSLPQRRHNWLYVDSDSYFHRAPESLLNHFTAEIAVAPEPEASSLKRPEPVSLRAWVTLLRQQSYPFLQPFNTGAILFRHSVLQSLLAQSELFLEQLISAFVGLQARSDLSEVAQKFYAPVFTALKNAEPPLPAPLDFPGHNFWLLEEFSYWLLCAQNNFKLHYWKDDSILLGARELKEPGHFARPVLSHYFHNNQSAFFNALRQNFKGIYR